MNLCPICNRFLTKTSQELHHLIPKTFKGKETISIHRICHKQIHALWTERELHHHYNTIERIVSDEKMQRFIVWVQNKPLDFNLPTKDSTERKSKRRK
jgi:uncharacterized protein with PIN domain